MDASRQLEAKLVIIAQRSADIKAACGNEESTKQHLVLPVIGALGYDCANPYVLQPEYPADFRTGFQERADYVVLRDGVPIIAIECKRAGTDLAANRGQLRAYFTALHSVRLGILTDGLTFEFFTDCETSNIMDAEPFAVLDMEAAARGFIAEDVLDVLSKISFANFEPNSIAETAEMLLVAKQLRALLMQEVRDPSDEFCRFILQQLGIKSLRRASIQSRYGGLIRSAFEEALIIPVLEALRTKSGNSDDAKLETDSVRRSVTTDRELAVYRYACRRLAYLAKDEDQFSAIERVRHRDYIGKFAVYYENVRKGRLFDFIEGASGFDKFVFPEPYGEIETNVMTDIDEPLRAIFFQRVRELGRRSIADRGALLSA